MTRTIRVDDEVFAKLQGLAKPFVDTPNSTLRKLLGLEVTSAGSGAPTAVRISASDQTLAPLLADGRLQAGQQLVWRRRNLRREHHAVVLPTGQLRLEDDSVHNTPSGAATALAKSQQNGWTAWTTEHGTLLDDLR
ncbi:hypothetical protein [Streptomyces sp. CA-111067]|uniref:restriction system modified-DNA reader domain-containing protein n=1 Tax=Streptomyces sp. CA-111067 TaxID=3240046 RepID=UPI003D984D34